MASGVWNLGGLTLSELGRRTWKEMQEDGVYDAAAQLAYYFLLALFPLLIFVISLLATIDATALAKAIMEPLGRSMPGAAYQLIGAEIERIISTPKPGLMTFGALGTLWAASSGVASIVYTLDRAYDVSEGRSFIKLRGLALALTISLVLLIISGGVLLTAGDVVSTWMAGVTGAEWLRSVGPLLNAILGLLLMFVGLELVYYFGPNVPEQKWAWVSPGSAAAVGLFVIASVALSLYLRFGDTYSATYGAIGGVIILMLWLYLLGFAVVMGGEINAEIAHAALARGQADAPNVAEPKKEGEQHPDSVIVGTFGPVPGEGTAMALTQLLDTLGHPNTHVRAATLASLRSAGPAATVALQAVVRALADPDTDVRREAEKTLEYIAQQQDEVLRIAAKAIEHPAA